MSKSPENDKPSKKGFLFINKDASSISFSARRGDKHALKTITSHAQKWRVENIRQKRIESTRRAAQQTHKIVGWQWAGSPSPQTEGTASLSSEASSSEERLHASATPSLSVNIIGNSTDPFIYLESRDDAWWMHDAFQYSVNIYLPVMFKSIMHVRSSGGSSSYPTMRKIIQGCLHSKLHMYCLLAASTGRLKFVQKTSLKRVDSPEFCTAKAIQHLRAYLADFNHYSEQQVIFDLTALATVEGYFNNYEGARTHLRMADRLISLLGGFSALDASLCSLCYMRDLLVAGMIDEPPIFNLMWDPGPLPQNAWKKIQNALIVANVRPMGKILLAATSTFAAGFRTVIRDLVQCAQVLQYISLDDRIEGKPYENWAINQAYALRRRLLSQKDQRNEGAPSLLADCVRITLLIWTADVGIIATRQSTATRGAVYSGCSIPRTIARLRAAYCKLKEASSIPSKNREAPVLWMVVYASITAPPGSDKDFFCHELQELVALSDIHGCERLNTLLLDYLGPFYPRPSVSDTLGEKFGIRSLSLAC